MDNWEDLTTKLFNHCLNLWGEPITYYKVSGEQFMLSGIVDLTALRIEPDYSAVVQSIQPQVRFNSDALSFPPAPGDRIVIRNQTYHVIESQTDGQGTLLCFLHHESATSKAKH